MSHRYLAPLILAALASCSQVVGAQVVNAGPGPVATAADRDIRSDETVATVDGDPISHGDVVLEFLHPAGNSDGGGKSSRRAALDRVVQRRLFVHQALAMGLNRSLNSPKKLSVEQERELAEAYLVARMGASAVPSEAEVSAFYDAHPNLFARRRVYDIKELTTAWPASRAEELRRLIKGSGSIEVVAATLQKRRIAFDANRATRTAEQLPMELVNEIAAQKPGVPAVFVSASGALTVRQIAASTPQPVSLAESSAAIKTFLFNERHKAVLAEVTRELMARATVVRLRDPGE